MINKSVLVCLLVAPLCGCASLLGNISYSELERDVGSRVYIGTKIDATFLASPFRLSPKGEAHQSWRLSLLIFPFALVDFPLSLSLDSILLPYSLSVETKGQNK